MSFSGYLLDDSFTGNSGGSFEVIEDPSNDSLLEPAGTPAHSGESVTILPSVTSSDYSRTNRQNTEELQEQVHVTAANDTVLFEGSILSISTAESGYATYTAETDHPNVILANQSFSPSSSSYASSSTASQYSRDDDDGTLLLSVPSSVPSQLTMMTNPSGDPSVSAFRQMIQNAQKNNIASQNVHQHWHEYLESEQDWEQFRSRAADLLGAVDTSTGGKPNDELLARIIQQEEEYFWSRKANNQVSAKAANNKVVTLLKRVGWFVATIVLPVVGVALLGPRVGLRSLKH